MPSKTDNLSGMKNVLRYIKYIHDNADDLSRESTTLYILCFILMIIAAFLFVYFLVCYPTAALYLALTGVMAVIVYSVLILIKGYKKFINKS